MIEPKELKVGLLVWWANDSWSCPGVITKVDLENNTFRVKTFDTMEETADLRISRPAGCDKSRLEEMEITTEEKILAYLSEKELSFKKYMLEIEQKLSNLKGIADQYSKKANILRNELHAKIPEGVMPK